ncbi:conserved hypothetical protein [Solidesulfovibrio fructosivorans JJ]]|uniref:Uncharacterized protein n=1 Tax=Solidesulfovibrio fructosivorans JJ] TaxID=596151 RepID=E1JVE3_SOLFR|nr:hypothetical protein [Solidesulfovibrio fructosivorans]EFL51737.1 conserved hypothetical protein [Solidesulfovibrio fructosivorans JJ]]
MAKVWPKRPLVLALVLAIAVCVGAAASAGRRGAGLGAYARVLKAAEASRQTAPDPVADCLMAARLLQAAGGDGATVDATDFEALRAYCRAQAREAASPKADAGGKHL